MKALPPFFENKGWADLQELLTLTFYVDAGSGHEEDPKYQAFCLWRREDGTKSGLVALGFRPDWKGNPS